MSTLPQFGVPLSVEEACRFRALIEEAVERLELLGIITAENAKRPSVPLASRARKDVYSLMAHQKELEDSYELLKQRQNHLRGLSNKVRYLQNQAELRELASQLRTSTATIAQNLKDQPAYQSNLGKINKDRMEIMSLLQCTSADLEKQTFITLTEEVNARVEQQRLVGDTRDTQERTTENLKKLEAELELEQETFREQDEEKKKKISELSLKLKNLKKVTSLTLKYEQESSLSKAEMVVRVRKTRLDGLRAEIAKVRAELDMDAKANARTAEFLTEQKKQLDALNDEWEKRYQQDFSTISKSLEELTAVRDRDLKKLVALQERWHADKEQRLALEEEKKRRQQEESAKKRLHRSMVVVLASVRFFWPVYAKQMEALKKTTKKKKTSKKKKGSKK